MGQVTSFVAFCVTWNRPQILPCIFFDTLRVNTYKHKLIVWYTDIVLTKGEIMKDILLGVIGGLIAFGVPAVVYVLKTGGISWNI